FMLLPIAGIIALNIIGVLPTAFANPLVLIVVFVYFAVVAYTFTSFIFFLKGLQNGKALNPSLKDWIKANAFVTLLFAGFAVLSALVYFGSPDAQKQAADNFDKLKDTMGGLNVTRQQFITLMRGALLFLGGYGALLITHIIITFRLMKKNVHLF